MGYEIEALLVAGHRREAGSPDLDSLRARWRTANRRLAAALAGYRALHGVLACGDPAWIAAQLRIAEARQRCRELADALADGVDGDECCDPG